MNKPSKQWKQVRHATLERVRSQLEDAMTTFNIGFIASCIVYIAGLIRFNFLPVTAGDYTWLDATQIIATAGSGLMLLILSGAVLTLSMVSARLETITKSS